MITTSWGVAAGLLTEANRHLVYIGDMDKMIPILHRGGAIQRSQYEFLWNGVSEYLLKQWENTGNFGQILTAFELLGLCGFVTIEGGLRDTRQPDPENNPSPFGSYEIPTTAVWRLTELVEVASYTRQLNIPDPQFQSERGKERHYPTLYLALESPKWRELLSFTVSFGKAIIEDIAAWIARESPAKDKPTLQGELLNRLHQLAIGCPGDPTSEENIELGENGDPINEGAEPMSESEVGALIRAAAGLSEAPQDWASLITETSRVLGHLAGELGEDGPLGYCRPGTKMSVVRGFLADISKRPDPGDYPLDPGPD